jgi:hypothetical protein
MDPAEKVQDFIVGRKGIFFAEAHIIPKQGDRLDDRCNDMRIDKAAETSRNNLSLDD